jgi:hypothetical protein
MHTLDIDIAKNTYQLHGADPSGKSFPAKRPYGEANQVARVKPAQRSLHINTRTEKAYDLVFVGNQGAIKNAVRGQG